MTMMAVMLVLVGANVAFNIALGNVPAVFGWFTAGFYVWLYYTGGMS